MKRTALDFIIAAEAWGILPDALDKVLAIAEREGLQPELYAQIEAVLTQRGEPLPDTRYASVRDGVAVIPIEGPLFPKANLMTEFSGATSVSTAIRDLYQADANPDISGIVLDFHTPGGVAKGIIEASGAIAKLKKPTVAYVSGLCCSAGFPLAAAANGGIVVSPDATLGSLGVVLSIPPKKKDGPLEIVSALSPDKRPDHTTDPGRAVYQKLVDDLAAVFLSTVAGLRSTTVEHLATARGGLLVGQNAIDFGLADRLGSLEAVIAELSQRKTPSRRAFPPQGARMDLQQLKAEHPEVYQAAFAEGKTAGFDAGKAEGLAVGASQERERIHAIEALAMPGHEQLIATLKADGKTTGPEAAMQILAAEKAKVGNAAHAWASEAPAPVPNAPLPGAATAGPEANAEAQAAKEAEQGWNNAFNKATGKKKC